MTTSNFAALLGRWLIAACLMLAWILPLRAADAPPAQQQAERQQTQPGNNAPMCRQVGGGVTGTSSLPKSEAPEAGNLIQPFVQYPGSRLTNAGEAWREVRNGLSGTAYGRFTNLCRHVNDPAGTGETKVSSTVKQTAPADGI